MKLTFISNFFNHHQKPLSDYLYSKLGDNYTFISTIPMPEAFTNSGYEDFSKISYHLKSFENQEELQKTQNIIENSDAVIIGAAHQKFVQNRIENNKLTFWYSERIFKKGPLEMFNPRRINQIVVKHSQNRNKNVFLLSASAFTSNDLSWYLAYPKKRYKWGYFTKVQEVDVNQKLQNIRNTKIKFLVVSRLIDWKHPELALNLAAKLKDLGHHNFEIDIVGSGPMDDELKSMSLKYDLASYVTFRGNIPNEEVLQLMSKTHVFLFLSDRNEGWGAVLNEAMANGCAVICSSMVGAAPYLVKPNKNGVIFKSKSVADLTTKTLSLLNNEALREKLSLAAYNTMKKTWSPKNAGDNLLKLIDQKINGENNLNRIEEGPCSKAFLTYKNWYKKEQ